MFFSENISKVYNFITGTKWVYHSLFWFTYTLFWHVVASPQPFTPIAITISTMFLLVDAGAAYINLYYLMPRYFYPKKYFKYTIGLILNIALFVCLMIGAWAIMESAIFGQDFGFPSSYATQSIIGSVIGVFAITMMIKLAKRGIETDKKNEALEKEKLSTELKFLKSQLNPHFLFNALNSIYFMIKKDPDLAADALANFSDMLRYQIYDCNDSKISLKKEVEYLENFIRISKLRKREDFKMNVSIDEKINGEMVAPLVLIPFVENAFKHVSVHRDLDNWINVQLDLKGQDLEFVVENSIEKDVVSDEAVKVGGLGLPNVKRRLDLLYPNKHNLKIEETEDKYKVSLKLKLN